MAARKGSGLAISAQPNAAQKHDSPHLAKNPHAPKPRVGHPQRNEKQIPHPAKNAGIRDDTLKERRKWELAVKKKNEKRRRKYRAVHGKVVDWVDHWIEEGWLFVSMRFQDKTEFYMQFGAKMVAEEIALRDARSGSLRLMRQYFRREE